MSNLTDFAWLFQFLKVPNSFEIDSIAMTSKAINVFFVLMKLANVHTHIKHYDTDHQIKISPIMPKQGSYVIHFSVLCASVP